MDAAANFLTTTSSALLLDENSVLQRRLHLPWLAGADLDTAVQLQAITFSPFDPQDLVYAYHSQPSLQGGLQVDMVLVSKKTIENARKEITNSYQLKSEPEIWLPSQSGPILCPGWGEQPRLQQERRQRLGLMLGASNLYFLINLNIRVGRRRRENSLVAAGVQCFNPALMNKI